MLAPLAAVLLFLAAIVAAFWYLRAEEVEREQESVRRDVEYAQQRVRLRLLERQEQLMRLARDASNREIDASEFPSRAESHGEPVSRNCRRSAGSTTGAAFKASYAAPMRVARRSSTPPTRCCGPATSKATTRWRANCVSRCSPSPLRRTRATRRRAAVAHSAVRPGAVRRRRAGRVLGRRPAALRRACRSLGALRRVAARRQGRLLAGTTVNPRESGTRLLPWTEPTNEYAVPVSPVGNGLLLRAQA